MQPEAAYTITLSDSAADNSICAQMMATTDPWITLGMKINQCLQAFEGDYREVYLLKHQQEILGFMILQVKGSFKGYIQTLCIAEKHRGKQLGTLLLSFAEKQVLKYSPNIFICVSAFNTNAIRLYTGYGFEQVGVLKNFVAAGYDELLLRKTAGPILGYHGKQ
jgi:ribosomal protein S18 acetylase RimI-like enzyme